MMKKTSSRNQRSSRGIKGKHVLQICVLLGVCVWLIYQVKYSHDKKKEFYEKDVEASMASRSEDGIVKLGRKDLPRVQELTKNEWHEEELEDEEVVSEEEIRRGQEEEKERENKRKAADEHRDEEEKEEEDDDDEEEEEKNKRGGEQDDADDEENKDGEEQEVEDDDRQGVGDVEDDIDEHDPDGTGEIHKEDGFPEEENEKGGDSGEKEIESNKRDEEKGRQAENDNNQDEIDRTAHEAREEHYKADDASSAVSHESQIVNTENGKESSGSSETNVAGVTVEAQNKSINTYESKMERSKSVLKLGEADGSNSVNTTNTEERKNESESSGSDVRRETRSDEHPEANSTSTEPKVETDNSNSTVINLEASGLAQNGTESTLDRIQARNKTETAAAATGASSLQATELVQPLDSNLAISANTENKGSIHGQSVNSTSESALLEKSVSSNATEVKENSESLTVKNEDSGSHDESGSKESLNLSSTNETIDTAQDDPVDSSDTTITDEEREALTDPDTLPDIRTEGSDNEEIAAE